MLEIIIFFFIFIFQHHLFYFIFLLYSNLIPVSFSVQRPRLIEFHRNPSKRVQPLVQWIHELTAQNILNELKEHHWQPPESHPRYPCVTHDAKRLKLMTDFLELLHFLCLHPLFSEKKYDFYELVLSEPKFILEKLLNTTLLK